MRQSMNDNPVISLPNLHLYSKLYYFYETKKAPPPPPSSDAR